MKIIQASSDDWDAICGLLDAAALPTSDLGPAIMENFLVGRVDVVGREVTGAIGFEQIGELGLLRSLVVDVEERNSGLGERLVGALEARAAASDIAQLYLLTIDADGFFARLGFEVVPRADTPESIRATREFSELCPDDAVVMKKVLPTVRVESN